MWAFHHIPKTAGSSVVMAWREAVAEKGFANVFVSEEDLSAGEDYSAALDRKFLEFQDRASRGEVYFACGHFTHGQVDRLIAAGARLFAFLRHPIDRLISDYKYQLNPPSFAPEQFARRYPSFEHYIRDADVHNIMCRFIVGVPDARLAIEKLNASYLFAGTTDQLSESNRLLMIRAGVTPVPLSRVNTSSEVSRRRLKDRARYERVLERQESQDLALYDRISAQMTAAMASLRE